MDNNITKKLIIGLLSNDWEAEKLAEELKEFFDDKSFVIEVVGICPEIFKYLDEKWRDDENVAIFAIWECEMVKYVSSRLLDNKGFVIDMLDRRPGLLCNVSARLKDDEDVILATIRSKSKSLKREAGIIGIGQDNFEEWKANIPPNSYNSLLQNASERLRKKYGVNNG